jgi:hypothetical protein
MCVSDEVLHELLGQRECSDISHCECSCDSDANVKISSSVMMKIMSVMTVTCSMVHGQRLNDHVFYLVESLV